MFFVGSIQWDLAFYPVWQPLPFNGVFRLFTLNVVIVFRLHLPLCYLFSLCLICSLFLFFCFLLGLLFFIIPFQSFCWLIGYNSFPCSFCDYFRVYSIHFKLVTVYHHSIVHHFTWSILRTLNSIFFNSLLPGFVLLLSYILLLHVL